MPNDQAIGCVYTYLCQVKHVNGLKVVILHFNHGGGGGVSCLFNTFSFIDELKFKLST
jgi:hypothetical protein